MRSEKGGQVVANACPGKREEGHLSGAKSHYWATASKAKRRKQSAGNDYSHGKLTVDIRVLTT